MAKKLVITTKDGQSQLHANLCCCHHPGNNLHTKNINGLWAAEVVKLGIQKVFSTTQIRIKEVFPHQRKILLKILLIFFNNTII